MTSIEHLSKMISDDILEHIDLANKVFDQCQSNILLACSCVSQALDNGNRIYIFGNGGSAADAQHIAAEFTGRFVKERIGLPAMALTTDTSVLTAISNDYGYDEVYRRQVEALALPGDVLIGISTSGNSLSVINALKLGVERGCKTIALTGRDGGKITAVSDINIIVPSFTTARIQEMHILIGHTICNAVDQAY